MSPAKTPDDGQGGEATATVTRPALQSAASITGLMITTECLVADKPEEQQKMPGGMGGGDMYWTGD